jgi:iron complex transport system substrate-binding protein
MRTTLRRRRGVVALLAASSLLLAACGDDAEPEAGGETPEADEAPEAVVVAHAQGETTVPVNPETVVVFDLGALVTLDELGVEVDGVPQIAALGAELPKYDDHPKVGTLFEPDYEAVNAMEPDLIIVGGRSSAVYPQLAELAPTIDLTVDSTDFMASFEERTRALGPIFGIEDEIDEQLAEIEAAVERVQGLAEDAGEALIVLTTGGEVSAYGPGSRFGLIHDVLGVTPAVEDVEAATHGDAISFEFILEANPDILYVVDRDSATGEEGLAAEQVLDNELVAQTTAWQQGAVHYLDPFDWYLAPSGLRSVAEMVGAIEDSLA